MKYFIDTEFIEKPCTIDLISIGLVSEDGKREFYAESSEIDWSQASDWVNHNVKPYLISEGADKDFLYPGITKYFFGTKEEIANKIKIFFRYCYPQFWGWFSDYDWVVFCWLFGTMSELPHHFPQYCLDIKQVKMEMGDAYIPPQMEGHHNALQDARWNRTALAHLENIKQK